MEPDRVVGIEVRCTILYTPEQTAEFRGNEGCRVSVGGSSDLYDPPGGGYLLRNRRQELTVRTPSGTSYTVNVPMDTKVALGDVWPSK
jgi:hypothetical protein